MVETPKFQDAEDYTTGFSNTISFKDIVLQHVKRIGVFASVEFHGGYWQSKEVNMGMGTQTIHEYVPDSREIYSNAVEYLADILYPHFDDEMKEAERKIKFDLENCKKSLTVTLNATNNKDENLRGFENDSFKVAFRDARVKICRKLFRQLCSFLYRKKYLELGVLED